MCHAISRSCQSPDVFSLDGLSKLRDKIVLGALLGTAEAWKHGPLKAILHGEFCDRRLCMGSKV